MILEVQRDFPLLPRSILDRLSRDRRLRQAPQPDESECDSNRIA